MYTWNEYDILNQPYPDKNLKNRWLSSDKVSLQKDCGLDFIPQYFFSFCVNWCCVTCYFL